MIASEIITRARHNLDEVVSDESHWSDDRMLSFLCEGQEDLVLRIPAPQLPDLFEYETRHLQVGVDLYALPGDWCTTIQLKLHGNIALVKTIEWEEPFTLNAMFLPSEDEPKAIEPYYDKQTKIFPVPTEIKTDGLKRIYLRLPATLTEVTQTPEIPPIYHQHLVNYLIYRCLLEDGDERATAMYQEYISKLGGK